MKKRLPFTLLSCLLFFAACHSNETNTTADSTLTNENEPTLTDLQEKVIAWVDQLNIRTQPNLKSKVVAKAKENDVLTLTGEKTDFTETISLRGNDYTGPWVKVETADGQSGWVFEGAIKRPGEDKGTPLNTATKFTYPHFGAFDLSTWEKLPSRDDGGEEVDVTTDIYLKDDRILEISISERGEFYYGKSFVLMDADRKVLKERTIDISVDVDYNKLTETVKDYTSDPPKQYTRDKDLTRHFFDINPKPDMAEGKWKMKTL